MSARIRARIRHLKMHGLTYEQQLTLLRIALEVDRRYLNTNEFAKWAKANQQQLAKTASEWGHSK